jgi:hypothetical protein
MKALPALLILTFFVLTQVACSVSAALKQPTRANIEGIGPGTPRTEVITRVGVPKLTETSPDGKKEDHFEFQSGFHGASKLRAIPYLAADIFTLGLAEIILWPIELTLMKDATCNGFATYDSTGKVETWQVVQKSGVQGC